MFSSAAVKKSLEAKSATNSIHSNQERNMTDL